MKLHEEEEGKRLGHGEYPEKKPTDSIPDPTQRAPELPLGTAVYPI